AGLETNDTAGGAAGGARERQQISTDSFIVLFIFSLIFCLGVLGNSLVITVLTRSNQGKPRSTTNIFILNLSIADLSYLLLCIPFQATYYVLPQWIFGGFICKSVHYFFTVSMLVSVFTLSAMAVDRYIAIVHSRKSSCIRVSRNAWASVVFIWSLSLAVASPVAYYHMLVYKDHHGPFCWENWSVLRHRQVYRVLTFLVGYLLPLCLISTRRFSQSTVGLRKSKRKLGKCIIKVVFCVSWLPHHVINLWSEFGQFPLTEASFAFRIAAHCLAYSNSSVNPIIYAFLSENFRKSYQQVFKCKICSSSPLKDTKECRSRTDIVPSTSCTNV
uniref:G-protein coupled receptors family 1 profile domain-containing protein n=1 Tax=Callorhinchus milii TaxID=7868 RepID=A0A4W3HQ72_CALMI